MSFKKGDEKAGFSNWRHTYRSLRSDCTSSRTLTHKPQKTMMHTYRVQFADILICTHSER
ncbi:hypothetical protein T265_07206 [Opisthorchis viverrini]|uniref:Uncharacterized protein n=1 Tax=Opisthorchis viverrini TaxID=6198 RepID=A0A074ZHU2_OPIVI|nr:hypothetical protein T265_07206 [Opisthorchis viverrini]KER25332.1 hypothetical protein T265_07206 [Opisthorchis viverrini]